MILDRLERWSWETIWRNRLNALDHRRRACLHHLEGGTPVRRRIDVMAQPPKKGFDEICNEDHNMGLSNSFTKLRQRGCDKSSKIIGPNTGAAA